MPVYTPIVQTTNTGSKDMNQVVASYQSAQALQRCLTEHGELFIHVEKSEGSENIHNTVWSVVQDDVKANQALDSIISNMPKSEDYSVVVFAQGLCLNTLSNIIIDVHDGNEARITANKYNNRFGMSVVNIAFVGVNQAITAAKLMQTATKYCVDISNRADVSLSQPGVALFDMDSTIIEMECIDEIASLAGVGEEVARVTERAMAGEIAFSDSLIHRVACLKGVQESSLRAIRNRLPFSPGFSALVSELKSLDWHVAIASGGFTYFADYIKDLFELDFAVSNTLAVEQGVLIGEVTGHIVDAEKKASVLVDLAAQFSIPLTQTIAVGDGANDLVMMEKSAFGIAYHAKPKVQEQAQGNITYAGLEAVLYTLG